MRRGAGEHGQGCMPGLWGVVMVITVLRGHGGFEEARLRHNDRQWRRRRKVRRQRRVMAEGVLCSVMHKEVGGSAGCREGGCYAEGG